MKRSISQGKNISASDAKFYKSLGTLIKDYREWREISQESFAASLGISVRQLRNWEANRNRVRIDNMHDLAEVTGIPMQVCIVLNADQPVWYSIRKRRFALSSLEKELFSSDDLLRYHEQSDNTDLFNKENITTDKHISMILASHHDIYGSEKPMPVDVIKAATRLLPELNRIVFDCWGHYVGHQICLPLTEEVYREINKKGTCEGYLTSDRLSDILALQQGVFFTYSIFSASMSVGYIHNIANMRCLDKTAQKANYLVAINSATEEGQIHLSNLGFRLAGNHDRPPNRLHPNIYEVELADMTQALGPHGALEWMMLNEKERKAKAEEMIRKNQREMLPVPGPRFQRPNRSRGPGHEYISEKIASDGELTVGGYLTVEKGYQNNQKAKYGQEIETCPNPACNMLRKEGKANVIFNGTYRTKDGTTARRFLCKECGGSFCSRAKSIFYGLRSPQAKVLTAFKLLLKGMSLRGAAKVLGVDHHTIRHWLTFIVGQSGKIDSLLMEQLQISQIELDTLRSFDKKFPAINNVF